MSLQAGPDSEGRFIAIKDAYETLSDPAKRELYDLHGTVEGDRLIGCYESKVEAEDIEQFAAEYPGSQEEAADVVKFFNNNNGNVVKIFDSIPMAEPSQACFDRFMKIIEEHLTSEDTSGTKLRKKFKDSESVLRSRLKTLQQRQKREEARFTREYGEEMSFKDLAAMIKANQKSRKETLEASMLAITAGSQSKKTMKKLSSAKKSK